MRETGRHGEKIRPARKILPPRLHKASFERLDSRQTQTQGGSDVVKGVSHRVIVVKSPDKYFEEAIFVIREDVLQARGADSASVMRQARRAANEYVKKRGGKPQGSSLERLPAPLFAAAGAAATGIAWLAMHLYHL